MPKTIKLESHLSSEELEYRYRKAHDPVLRSHYQIIWLISEGKTTRQVMEEALVERCVALSDQRELIRSYTCYHWWPQTA
jgi:hypothetical protein